MGKSRTLLLADAVLCWIPAFAGMTSHICHLAKMLRFVVVLGSLDHVCGTLVGGDTGFGIQPATAMMRTAAFFKVSDKRPSQHDQDQNNDNVSNYITHNSPKYSLLVQFQIFQIPGGLNATLD